MKSGKRDPQQITRTASNEVLEKWGVRSGAGLYAPRNRRACRCPGLASLRPPVPPRTCRGRRAIRNERHALLDATQRARTAERESPGRTGEAGRKRRRQEQDKKGGAAVESEAEERRTAERETETEKASRNPSVREGAQWEERKRRFLGISRIWKGINGRLLLA